MFLVREKFAVVSWWGHVETRCKECVCVAFRCGGDRRWFNRLSGDPFEDGCRTTGSPQTSTRLVLCDRSELSAAWGTWFEERFRNKQCVCVCVREPWILHCWCGQLVRVPALEGDRTSSQQPCSSLQARKRAGLDLYCRHRRPGSEHAAVRFSPDYLFLFSFIFLIYFIFIYLFLKEREKNSLD